MTSPRISALFPDVFAISRPVVSGTRPLIQCAGLLFPNDVQFVPISNGSEPRINPKTRVREYPSLGTYAVLDAILRIEPKNYMDLARTKCQDIAVWISSVSYKESLDDLMKALERNGFGSAMVESIESDTAPSLVTLQDIVLLYRTHVLKSELRVSDVSSKKYSITSDSSLTDALNLMLEKDVRRIFLSEETLRFVSARDIFKFLFSPSRLRVLEKSPESWLDERLSNIPSNNVAKPVPDDNTINQVSKEIGDGVDDCFICKTSQEVVSRWDIVMKPWQVNSLEVAL